MAVQGRPNRFMTPEVLAARRALAPAETLPAASRRIQQVQARTQVDVAVQNSIAEKHVRALHYAHGITRYAVQQFQESRVYFDTVAAHTMSKEAYEDVRQHNDGLTVILGEHDYVVVATAAEQLRQIAARDTTPRDRITQRRQLNMRERLRGWVEETVEE